LSLTVSGCGRLVAGAPGKPIDLLNDAELIESSATVVDAAVLNVGGFTELDFDPVS